MFTRAFPKLEPRDDLAFLDTHDYTTCALADQLRYCESLCALTEVVSKRRLCDPIHPISFAIPLLDGAAFSTSSPHFAIVYHALLLATRVANEKALTSLRDPRQAELLRRVVGIFEWERTHGEHQRTAMRKTMPMVVVNFENMWRGMQIALQWVAQFEEPHASVKPAQEAPGLVGIIWSLESLLLDAHMARQTGQYSHSRRLYERARRMHDWMPPKELDTKFLSAAVASLFQDHDPADTTPLVKPATTTTFRGTPPPTIFG